MDATTIAEASEFLFNPGISVMTDAITTCQTVRVHCLHDPTEGGLATGLWEIAKAAEVGIVVALELYPRIDRVPGYLPSHWP